MSLKTKEKNSNIELLRIIAMLLIIAHHYSLHGLSTITLDYSIDRLVFSWLVIGGKAGVDIFVLISGYYMCKSKFDLKKFLKLYGQVLFYSITFFLIFKIIIHTNNDFGIYSFIKTIFPILNNKYWFITTYIYLMLLTPVINIIISKLSKKELKNIITISIIICSLIPSFYNVFNPANELIWFIIIYLIAAYIRMYNVKINQKITLISSIVFYILIILFNILEFKFQLQTSIIVLLFSVSIFLHFINKKEKHNKILSLIGSTAFGVYLIHDNEFVRSYMWKEIFKCQEYYGTGLLLVHSIITILIIYIVGTMIELIRINTIEKLWIKVIEQINKYTKIKLIEFKNIINIINSRIKNKEKIIKEKYLKVIISISIILSFIIIYYITQDILIYILKNCTSNVQIIIELTRYILKTIIYIFIPIAISIFIILNKIYIERNKKIRISIRIIMTISTIIIFKIIKQITIKKIIYSYYLENVKDNYVYFIMIILWAILIFSINIIIEKK